MKNQPSISILIPVYNTAPWLRRCLGSICGQTYPHLEIICVNDGSTDESANILEEYAAKDSRIKIITQENGGLSAARNTGLEHATGEWVTGVDSDDYIAPDLYEKAVACASDAVDMVFFGVQEVDETGRLLPPRAYFDLPERGGCEMTPELAEKVNVCFCSKLWRRSVLEKHHLRFPVGLLHEDEALYYTALPHIGRVAVCANYGYMYVQRAGSIMHSADSFLEQAKRYLPALEFVYEQIKEGAGDEDIMKWYLLMVRRMYESCYHACAAGERAQLSDMFYAVACKHGVLPAHIQDYRYRCMKPVRGWHRLFISRYLKTELYRFLGIPVWQVEYKDGKKEKSTCVLMPWLLSKCGLRGKVS